jgi:hypothetical protein
LARTEVLLDGEGVTHKFMDGARQEYVFARAERAGLVEQMHGIFELADRNEEALFPPPVIPEPEPETAEEEQIRRWKRLRQGTSVVREVRYR